VLARFAVRAVLAAGLAVLPACALSPPNAGSAAQPAPPENPFVGGNQARLLVDGPRTHRAMFEAIAAARDHVNIETYILDGGELAQKLAALLAEKVKSGVKVHVMYDSVGSIGAPKAYFQDLRDAGVAVCEFNPVQRVETVNHRNHRKITVVDGKAYHFYLTVPDSQFAASKVIFDEMVALSQELGFKVRILADG